MPSGVFVRTDAHREACGHYADRGCWLPTLDEIRHACLEIQATWTDSIREKRLAIKPQPLTIVVVSIPEISDSPHEAAFPVEHVPLRKSWQRKLLRERRREEG